MDELKAIFIDTFLTFHSILLYTELVASYQDQPSVDCAWHGGGAAIFQDVQSCEQLSLESTPNICTWDSHNLLDCVRTNFVIF